MSASKRALEEHLEKEAKEIVTVCDNCGTGITAERLNEMPYEDGDYVFILCDNCL